MAIYGSSAARMCRVAGVYVGSVVGAGFASGREIWCFFARFGQFGFIGLAAASALFCALAPLLMRTMRANRVTQYGELYRRYLGAGVAGTVDLATTVYLFGVLSVMFTGSATLTGSVLKLSPCWSAIITAAILIVFATRGLDWVATASSFLSPVLVAGVSLLCIHGLLTRPVAAHTHVWSDSVALTILGSSSGALMYVSYNMLLCIGVFASLASSRHETADLVRGGVLGGAVLGVMASLVLITLFTEPAQIEGVDMPLLLIASRQGGIVYFAYIGAIWAAMTTTALSMLLSLTSRLAALSRVRRGRSGLRGRPMSDSWLGAALVLLCVPISYTRFGPLMDRVYLVFGLVGFSILALVIKSIRKPGAV